MLTLEFWKGALERAAKTFIQSFVATLLTTVGAAATAWEVPWGTALSAALGVALLATILSLATSLGNADFTAGKVQVPVEVKIDSDAVLGKINENPSQYLEKIEFDPGNHDIGYVAGFTGEVDPELASPGDVLELRLDRENAGTVTVQKDGSVGKHFRRGEVTGSTFVELYTEDGDRAYATKFDFDTSSGKHVAE